MMRKTGKYKTLNMAFGFLPFVAAILLTQMREDSNQAHLWLSIASIHYCRFLRFVSEPYCSFGLDTTGLWECGCASNNVQ
jgi:uncharacterized membrane protein